MSSSSQDFPNSRTRRDSEFHEVSRQYKNGETKPTNVFIDRHE